jgi:hypothetical protein
MLPSREPWLVVAMQLTQGKKNLTWEAFARRIAETFLAGTFKVNN